MPHRFNTDKDGYKVRKAGPRALYRTEPETSKEGLYARIELEDRQRMDAIRRNDGPRSIAAMLVEFSELYDFMMGIKAEPAWLQKRQNLYRQRKGEQPG